MTIVIPLILIVGMFLYMRSADNHRTQAAMSRSAPLKQMPSRSLRAVAGWNIGINILLVGALLDELFNPEGGTGDGSAAWAIGMLGLASVLFLVLATPFYIHYLKKTNSSAGGRKLLLTAIIINTAVAIFLVLINTIIKVRVY